MQCNAARLMKEDNSIFFFFIVYLFSLKKYKMRNYSLDFVTQPGSKKIRYILSKKIDCSITRNFCFEK